MEITKELILVNADQYSAGEYRTLNIYFLDSSWRAHWEDDDAHYGPSFDDVRYAALAEAAQRWPGFRGPWSTIEEARAALLPDDERWVVDRLAGLI